MSADRQRIADLQSLAADDQALDALRLVPSTAMPAEVEQARLRVVENWRYWLYPSCDYDYGKEGDIVPAGFWDRQVATLRVAPTVPDDGDDTDPPWGDDDEQC
jgi:hypothetical protein